MESILFTAPVSYPVEDLFRALKMDYDPDREETDVVLELREEAMKIAAPKAVYKESLVEVSDDGILIDKILFPHPLLAKKLTTQTMVYPYALSCGTELEEWSHRFTDPLEAYVADGIKVFTLYRFMGEFHQHIKETRFGGGTFSALNPGSLGEWPIEGQLSLFALLGDAESKAGITLTKDYLMVPTKASSGIFFASETEYHNCSHCLRLDCPNRRAEFCSTEI
ncbi:MAG: vitamin B12 dependent methionine synthase [Clostridia bacterium]|nr:vitamin B12 dependent methionine synthase [Clostridia bacterium]